MRFKVVVAAPLVGLVRELWGRRYRSPPSTLIGWLHRSMILSPNILLQSDPGILRSS